MMKIKIVYIVMFLVAFNQLKAQEKISSPKDEYVMTFDSLKVKDKLHYQFTTGASVMFSNNNHSYTSLYYSPSVSYEVSPKLEIAGGMLYSNGNMQNFNPIGDIRYQPFSGNISQYETYIAAKFRLNDRLAIVGEVFYNMTQLSPSAFNQNQHISSIDRLGYAASVIYKINENTIIEAQIRINDSGRYGFGRGLFGNTGFDSDNSFNHGSSLGFPYRR